MINALNLKLQVLITSFRLLKKPTQTYFLECKMLLIKYFSNTKAMCFGTQESRSEGSPPRGHPLPAMDAQHKGQLRADAACSVCSGSSPGQSLVQAHGGTLVHAHVGVTQKPSRTALDSSRVQGMQVLQRHLQVFSDFRAGGDLRNVEAILTPIAISHAVEEEPGRVVLAVLHKSNVMAGFYAEDSKQLHLLAGDAAMPPVPVR